MTLENAQLYSLGEEPASYEAALHNTLADLLSVLHHFVGGDWQQLEKYDKG